MAIEVPFRCVRITLLLWGLGSLLLNDVIAQETQMVPGSESPGMMLLQSSQWDFKAQDNEELYIPPAATRPLGEEAGPRIKVSSLVLEIDPLLDTQIDFELKGTLNQMLSSAVADNQAQGFTIGHLENTAADITNTLRSSGFILAWAYLPEQDVQNETVTIAILPGSLGTITVDGNARYSTERLMVPFSDLLGLPVEKTSIENSIMHLRDYPGLSSTAVFSPGTDTGTSELTLRVTEDPFDFAVVADNHGTRSTGEGRLSVNTVLNNPFGRADILSAVILQTFDPSENLYGGIAYETPFVSFNSAFGLSYSRNSFDLGGSEFADSDLGGDTDIYTIYGRHNMYRSRRTSVDLMLDLSVKQAELDGTPVPSEDNLSVVSLEFSIDKADQLMGGGINQFQIRYSNGIDDFLDSMDKDGMSSGGAVSTRLGGSGERAGGDFERVTYRYQRLQRISQSNSLLFRVGGQYSDDLLTSLEQFMMGGPNGVRAYPIAEFLMDEGIFTSLEWIVDVMQLSGRGGGNTSFSISGFGDYSHGELNDPLASQDPDVDLGGWGIGFSLGHTTQGGHQFTLRGDWSKPAGSRDASNGRDPQAYGELTYSFR